MTRANPFDDLSDFTAKTQAKPVEPQQIERIATNGAEIIADATAAVFNK